MQIKMMTSWHAKAFCITDSLVRVDSPRKLVRSIGAFCYPEQLDLKARNSRTADNLRRHDAHGRHCNDEKLTEDDRQFVNFFFVSGGTESCRYDNLTVSVVTNDNVVKLMIFCLQFSDLYFLLKWRSPEVSFSAFCYSRVTVFCPTTDLSGSVCRGVGQLYLPGRRGPRTPWLSMVNILWGKGNWLTIISKGKWLI